MPRQENQKRKLFCLLEMLIRKTDYTHGITMQEIISGLAATGIRAERKSVYDDFLVLEELGFPVEKMPTRPPRYMLSARPFELPELKLLVDAIQASKFISVKRTKELIEKLKAFAGVYGAGELERQVYVEGRAKTSNNQTIYTVDTIHSALNGNTKLSFKYYRYNSGKKKEYRNGGEPYLVSPISLIWQEEKYYLVAYDECATVVKHFRIDKMETVTRLDEARSEESLRLRIDPADYTQKVFGMYGGEEALVTLDCKEELANVIIDRFGTDNTFFKTEGGFRVTLRITVSPTFFGWLSELGDGVVITAPEIVREQYKKHLISIIEKYSEV